MINNYTDHAANERTYLAWIRTALGIMAFGFALDHFSSDHVVADNTSQLLPGSLSSYIGVSLLALGIALLIVSTIRFRHIERNIDAKENLSWKNTKTDILLGVLLTAMSLLILSLSVSMLIL